MSDLREAHAAFERAFGEYRQGRREQAGIALDALLARWPSFAPALHLRGFLWLEAGRLATAEPLLRQAIAAEPRDPGPHVSLGQALRGAGRMTEAAEAFRGALRLDSRNVAALNGLALCLLDQGRPAEALAPLQAALQADARQAQSHHNLGLVQERLGDAPAAEASFRAALACDPRLRPSLFALGRAMLERGRPAEAERPFRDALGQDASWVDARIGLALAVEGRGDAAEAEHLLREGPGPAHPAIAINLGNVLARQGRPAEALALFDAVLAAQPGLPPALHNRANVLVALGRDAEAAAGYRAAIAAEPRHGDAHFALARLLLGSGDYPAGWREFAWRPLVLPAGYDPARLSRAHDPGVVERLERERVLEVVEDQGLGDVMFFLRWAPSLRSRGWALRLRCNARLAPLLMRSGLFEASVLPAQAAPDARLALPVGDLPLLCGMLGGPALAESLRIPAMPQAVEAARDALRAAGPGPYRALTWRAGVPTRELGRQNLSKEIRPELLREWSGPAGTWIGLQRNAAPGEMETLRQALGPVADFGAWGADLEAMLGLMAALDGYVGVSNTNMHLLELLGRTATVAVPHPPEWRWAGSAGSPWFPGFRVARQQPDGRWNPPAG